MNLLYAKIQKEIKSASNQENGTHQVYTATIYDKLMERFRSYEFSKIHYVKWYKSKEK